MRDVGIGSITHRQLNSSQQHQEKLEGDDLQKQRHASNLLPIASQLGLSPTKQGSREGGTHPPLELKSVAVVGCKSNQVVRDSDGVCTERKHSQKTYICAAQQKVRRRAHTTTETQSRAQERRRLAVQRCEKSCHELPSWRPLLQIC